MIIIISSFQYLYANNQEYTCDKEWYSEDQREFHLSTPEQFIGLYELVNIDQISFETCEIILDKDIDLSNMQWNPIGTQWCPFNGVFNGNNHQITSLKIEMDTNSYGYYAGLFGYATGTIKNLILKGSIVLTENFSSGYGINIGTLCGYASTISDCYCETSIEILGRSTQQVNIGGIAGSASSMKNVMVTGRIINVNSGEFSGNLGGLANRCDTIDECSVDVYLNLHLWGGNSTKIAGICNNIGSINNSIFKGEYLINSNSIGGFANGIAYSAKKIENVIFAPTKSYVKTYYNNYWEYDMCVGGIMGTMNSSNIEKIESAYFTTNFESNSNIGEKLSSESIMTGIPLNGYDLQIWTFAEGKLPYLKSNHFISLDTSNLSLKVNEVYKLNVSLFPNEEESYEHINWYSSDENVVKVEGDGYLTAVNAGKAKISVFTASGQYTCCEITVTVKEIPVESISLDQTAINLNIGEYIALEACIQPENSTDKTIIWTSTNEEVAKVSSYGLVEGVNEGIAIVRATSSNGITASCMVTVVDNSGVEELESNEHNYPIYYFNINGSPISYENLVPGIYIQIRNNQSKKFIVQ